LLRRLACWDVPARWTSRRRTGIKPLAEFLHRHGFLLASTPGRHPIMRGPGRQRRSAAVLSDSRNWQVGLKPLSRGRFAIAIVNCPAIYLVSGF
jgi:hypothetical protein